MNFYLTELATQIPITDWWTENLKILNESATNKESPKKEPNKKRRLLPLFYATKKKKLKQRSTNLQLVFDCF